MVAVPEEQNDVFRETFTLAINEIKQVAQRNHVNFDQVHIQLQSLLSSSSSNEYSRFFPENYNKSGLQESYANYRDKAKPCSEILRDIYNVSLCQQVFHNRRRLLYKDMFKAFTQKQYLQMMKTVEDEFVKDYLKEQQKLGDGQ